MVVRVFDQSGAGFMSVVAEAAVSRPEVFSGRREALFGLLVRNGIFVGLTLGIYRFWAKTWLRRFFWNNITIGDHGLEYVGRPVELLLGFLIVMAVLIPGLVVYNLIFLFAGPFLPGAELWSDPLGLVILGWLVFYATYRARRYLLSRTVWRGVRFGQDGSAVRYAFLALLYTTLSFVTLSFGRPWARVALLSYRIKHSRFGDRFFELDARVGRLFVKWWPIPVLTAAALVTAVIALVAAGAADPLLAAGLIGGVDRDVLLRIREFQSVAVAVVAGIAAVVLIVLRVLLDIHYRVFEFQHLVEHGNYGDVRARAHIRDGFVLRVALVYALIVASLYGAAVGALSRCGLVPRRSFWWRRSGLACRRVRGGSPVPCRRVSSSPWGLCWQPRSSVRWRVDMARTRLLPSAPGRPGRRCSNGSWRAWQPSPTATLRRR